MELSITLKIPPKVLSPNHTVGSRGQRMAKASATKKYRTAAMVAVLVELPGGYKPKFNQAVAQIDWYARTNQRRDGDNALGWCKAAFDGITDSGFLSDDRGLTHLPVRFHVDKLNPRVVLTITVP